MMDALDRETDYAYDEMNQLTQVTSPSGSGNIMSYAYDLLGRLLTLTDFEGKQTSYAYDFRGRMTGVGPTAETSTGCLRDANKSSLGQYEYTPYGLVYGETGTSDIPCKYTGHEPDFTSMLYYVPFRYYNPVVARWTTRDPLGMADGVNVYGYLGQKALAATDPLGLMSRAWCEHVRYRLRLEEDLGTVAAIVPYSTIALFIGGPGSGDTDNRAFPTAYGPIDMHYWFDVNVMNRAGGPLGHMWGFRHINTTVNYLVVRIGGSIGEGWDWPWHEAKERNVMGALYAGYDTFAELFPPDFIKRECCE